jgi:NAD(P)-dependent dehydrogenase (short-subunit alcohol dehydrogenase family)
LIILGLPYIRAFKLLINRNIIRTSIKYSKVTTIQSLIMSTKFERSVLVTGGTSGLGYECALNIARKYPEYQIIIAARSDANSSAETINKTLRQNNAQFLPLDLLQLSKVRSFASDWESRDFPPIQSMVLNAALQFPGPVEYSDDGFEKTFAVSHIGHALLLSLLRPHLADTARIVIVSSGTHDPLQDTGMPDAIYNTAEELAHPTPESAKANGRQRYTSTKLANVLYTYALGRRFEAINKRYGKKWTVTAFDPGLMPGTGLARKASTIEKFLWSRVLPHILPLLRLVMSPNVHTVQESGKALARLAVGLDVEGSSAVYYEGMKVIESSEVSHDQAKQDDLWEWTVGTLAADDKEKRLFEFGDLQVV